MSLHTLTASEALALLERGEISALELTRALLARADETEPAIHAYAHLFREEALSRAREADDARRRKERLGPLHGLPLSVKESVDTRGVASTMGLVSRRHVAASQDAVTVRLARAAGAFVLGKTNVPQTLLSPMETTNFLFGTTVNPWSRAHGPGGSSGGEAAAIAVGSSLLGVGTDIGGSIRIPAAHAGVAGIKPSVDRWSNRGSNTAIPGQEVVRAQIGPMARSVADLTLLLRAIDSPLHARHDPRVCPHPIGDPARIDVGKLRVGFYASDGFFEPASSVQRAVRRAVEALRSAGADVVDARPATAEEEAYLYIAALSSDGAKTVEPQLRGERVIAPLKTLRRSARLSPAARRALATALRAARQPRVAKLLESIGEKPVDAFFRLVARKTELQVLELERWERLGIDAIVCPPHATPAVPHGLSHDFTLSFCYAARYNLLNLPAGVVPVSRVAPDETRRALLADRLDRRAAEIEAKSEGLPLGVQVVARPYREDVALAVMAEIERSVKSDPAYPALPTEPR